MYCTYVCVHIDVSLNDVVSVCLVFVAVFYRIHLLKQVS